MNRQLFYGIYSRITSFFTNSDYKAKAFTIEFLDNSPSMGRVITPLIRNLEKLGIQAQYRVVDYAVYEKRMKRFEYEMVSLALPGQEVPGAELRQLYHSF